MTSKEITGHLGIPTQTLRNWQSSSPFDWRYKLLILLKSEELNTGIVERAITGKPELQEVKDDLKAKIASQIESLRAQLESTDG